MDEIHTIFANDSAPGAKASAFNKFFAISSCPEKAITPFTMTRSAKTSDNNEWISLKFVKRLFDFYNLSSPANQFSEAATGGVLKKVFFEISQNSQENTCVRVSFLIKLQA